MIPRWLELPVHGDERGLLVAIEEEATVPFPVRRAYYLYATLPGVRRGLHAHRRTRQAAVCVSGACTFLLDNGRDRSEVRLARRDRALLVEPLVWHEMYDFTPDCVLLVLADALYDESDYVRRYSDFRALVGS